MPRNYTNPPRVNNTFLNCQLVIDEITEEFLKFLESNEIEEWLARTWGYS